MDRFEKDLLEIEKDMDISFSKCQSSINKINVEIEKLKQIQKEENNVKRNS